MPIVDNGQLIVFPGGTLPVGGASVGDVAAINTRVDELADYIGKILPDRATAVSWGPARLPVAYGRIITIEDGALVLRAPFQTADDPLFPGQSAQWGVLMRIPSLAAVMRGGIIPLVITGGVPNWPAAAVQGIFAPLVTSIVNGDFVSATFAAANTGPVQMTVAGIAAASPVVGADGQALTGGEIVGGRSYVLQRRGGNWRIISGDITLSEMLAERLARIASVAQTGTISLTGVAGTGDAITASVPSELSTLGNSAANLRRVRFQVAATNTGPVTINIDGQGAVSLRDTAGVFLAPGYLVAGRCYEAVKNGSTWQISSGEVTRAELATTGQRIDAEALARIDAQMARDLPPQPGDNGQVLARTPHGIASAIDNLGRHHGDLVAGRSGQPGDWLIEEQVDSRGVVVRGTDIRDGSEYDLGYAVSGQPGDWVVPSVKDKRGVVVAGIDVRTMTPFWAYEIADEKPEPEPEIPALQFYEPGFPGEVWGAVRNAEGVGKFTTLEGGVPLGMEHRGQMVYADTPSVALAMLAIGGGDILRGRGRGEQYRWHAFDEELDTLSDANGADGAAYAQIDHDLRNGRGRSTVFSIAEPIGSAVPGDVMPGAPRREMLVERLTAAVALAETMGKTVFVDRIKLECVTGARTTPQATANTMYGLAAVQLQVAVAEATRQGRNPRIIVNQSFGTRADGTSPTILAEGRLDWEHFAVGFLIPTSLYPFDLVPGTLDQLTPDALRLVSELETLAMAEVAQGREWFTPSMEEAVISGATITVRFASLVDLALRDPVNHGFAVDGRPFGIDIQSVAVVGKNATITLSGNPRRWTPMDTRLAQNRATITNRTADGFTAAWGAGGGARYVSWPTAFPAGTRIRANFTVTGPGVLRWVLDDNADLLAPNQVYLGQSAGYAAGSHTIDATVSDVRAHFGLSPSDNLSVTITNMIVDLPAGAEMSVRYAFGETGDRGDNRPANRGSLTDSWSAPAQSVATTTLYRFARSGRVTVRQGA